MSMFYVDISVNEGAGTKSGLTPDDYMGWNQFMYDYGGGYTPYLRG